MIKGVFMAPITGQLAGIAPAPFETTVPNSFRMADRFAPQSGGVGAPPVSPPANGGTVPDMPAANFPIPLTKSTTIPLDRLKITPHGSVIFRTAKGNVVFRPVASAVKSLLAEGPTRLVVMPNEPFLDIAQGRHRGEQEASLYHGFYMVNKTAGQIKFAISQRVKPWADIILRNSYTGPENLTDEEVAKSYPQGKDTPGFPNLPKELEAWRGFPLDTMRKYVEFDAANTLTFEDLNIIERENGVYVIYENGNRIGQLDLKDFPLPSIPHSPPKELSPEAIEFRQRVLIDGEPAIVPISSGSLFTKEETSGHMIFKNGRAIVIDPPADIMEWLEANGIPPDVIYEVVITHVHVDHAAGICRLLSRLPHRISFAAEPIIERQFVEMYRAMTLGTVDEDTIRKMWKPHPIKMKQAWQSVTGLWFEWVHSFHSIPTVGYILFNKQPGEKDSRIVASFSGDTQTDPKVVLGLLSKGVISSPARARDIYLLPLIGVYAGGLSLIDAGVQPLHTGIKFVASLASAASTFTEGRIGDAFLIAYHESQQKVEAEGVRYFGGGIGDAISLARLMNWSQDPATLPHRTQTVMRQALQRVPVLVENLNDGQFDELIGLGEITSFEAGTNIIAQDSEGDTMYVIVDGEVGVYKNGDPIVKRRSGIFGETAIVTGGKRNATVKAEQKTIVIRFKGDDIRDFLNRTGISQKMIDLAAVRNIAQKAMSESQVVSTLDAEARDILLLHATPQTYKRGDIIIQEGDITSKDVFLIIDGEAKVTATDGVLSTFPATLRQGQIVGEMAGITGRPRTASVIAKSETVLVLRIPGSELEALTKYPQLRAMFLALTVDRKATSGS